LLCSFDILNVLLKMQCKPDKPVFLMSWEGRNPKLPSILLNSHIDVVPVFVVSVLLNDSCSFLCSILASVVIPAEIQLTVW